MSAKKILIMAGGTGGHVFPGLAVADYLRARGWDVCWLGTATRMEAELVPKQGYPIEFIDIEGVRGNGVKRLLKAPLQIWRAISQAKRVLEKFQPDVVLGMGGFASGPGGVAAKLLGIPLVIHEQNATAGMTNRLLAKIAARVLHAFPGTFPATATSLMVGNPVRTEMLTLPEPRERAIGRAPELRLLIVGGSLGAKALNEVVPEAIANAGIPIRVVHQCGKGQGALVEQRYAEQGLKATVCEFITDMASAYASTDLVLCRAGALTVSEIAAAGLAAIFVPFPQAVDDHQTKNAMALVEAEAAEYLPQHELTAENLANRLRWLNERREGLLTMAQNARQQAIPDATARVAEICIELGR